jgi:diadenylate cyclase
MFWSTVQTIVRNVLDIALVWLIFYSVLKNIRNNVRMVLIFKGILFIVILKLVSDWLDLVTVGLLLEYVIMWGPLAIIIIFQPEIRNVLEQLGKTHLLGRHKVLTVNERELLVHEIALSLEQFRKDKIGALIVIERDTSLQQYIQKSTKLYADLSNDLLVSIFFPNNPLHDGGVIIQGNRITSAGAVFPTSTSEEINRRLGTRHRAAIGITEETDAIGIICSEETGRISLTSKGVLHYNLSLEEFRMMLLEELTPQTSSLVEIDEEEEVEDNE